MEYCEQLFRKEPLEEEDFNKELESISPQEDEADNPILLSEVKATIKRLKPEKSLAVLAQAPSCYKPEVNDLQESCMASAKRHGGRNAFQWNG